MKRVLFILIGICFMQVQLFSQNYRYGDECYFESPSSPSASSSSMPGVMPKYGDISYYVPYEYEASAVKVVNVNFIIIQDDYGNYNFNENNSADMYALSETKRHLNDLYTNLRGPSDPCPGVAYIPNSMIKFDIKTYFIKSSYALDNFYQDRGTVEFGNEYIVNNFDIPNYLDAFNVFFYTYKCAIDAINNNMGNFPMFDGTNYDELHEMRLRYFYQAGCVKGNETAGGSTYFPNQTLEEKEFSMINEANRYYFHRFSVITNNQGDLDWRAYTCAENIAHEFGHAFHLDHTFDDDIADTPAEVDNNRECDPYQTNPQGYDPCSGSNDNCTNNMVGYSCSRVYLSPLQLGRMHRSFALTTNYGKLKNSPFSSTPIEITSNETWDFNYRVFSNIVVKSGATLTITKKLFMPEQGSIIVERGGRLVVNGGTITNAFPSTSWKGIECWGNNGDLTKQYGRVTLTNATIENARVGVTLAKRGFSTIGPGVYQAQSYSAPPIQFIDIDMNYSGGYISASNSNFINNGRAVEFYTYSRTNTSTFNGCNFKITKSDYNMQNSMFYMYGTNGVKIVDCNFEVSDGVTVSGMRGIDSYNSAFKVYPSCTHSVNESMAHFTPYCPNPASDNYGVFKNLDYGIYATGNSGGLPYNVRFAKFVNTKRCIYSSGVDNIVITDCIMDVPKPTYSIGGSTDMPLISENALHYGVYCNGSTGYQIEGNAIKGVVLGGLSTGGYRQGTYGIVINNSGGAANMVYNNNLSYLEVGVQGQGENRDAVSGTGLCVACNTFSTNRTDIAVLSSTIATKNSIAKHQYRNDGKPAANIFSSDSYSGHLCDMYNYQGGPLINYYAYNSSVYKYAITKFYGSIIQYNASGSAATSHSVECPRTPGSYSIQSLGSSQEVVETTKMQLSTKVDGGNTLQLISSIEGATQNDSNELKDNLLLVSPYMSNDAVSAAIENEEAVSNVMVRDIMVGNNHAAREPELMGQVESRNNPLPAYMYDQIDYAANNSVSGLDVLQSNLQNSMVEYNVKFNVISNSMLSNDSIEDWEALMDCSINNDVRYGYAVYNALKGNISKANEVIASIEDLDSDYIDLFSVISNDSISYGKITEGSVETLMSIAESNNRVGVLANNILSGLGYIDYEEPIYTIPEESNFKRDKRQRRVADAMTEKLSVYPNPAKDYITVEYNAVGLGADLTMMISDIDGKVVRNDKLNNVVDSINVDIKRLTSGSYVLSLCSEGKVVYSKIFVVK